MPKPSGIISFLKSIREAFVRSTTRSAAIRAREKSLRPNSSIALKRLAGWMIRLQNRRTARLMETAVLVNHGITPLFPEESGFSSYPGAALSCCERGNVRKYAEFLLRASQQTIDSLLNRGEDFESARREDGERIRKYRSRG